MDIKQLLEKIDQFAGQAVGQKPGEQWRGTDKGTPGKKLVGGDEQQESVLKDLSKGRTPKTREQELAEEWATFSEENIGTHPKRARRTSDRHNRGHEPQARYKTVKADEAANPAQQAAIAIAMKKAGKKPKNEGAEQDPIVAKVVKQMRPGLTGLDMGNEAFLYFAYELGKQRARDAWEDYLPAIRAEYEQGLAEGWKDAAVGAAMLGALGGTAAYVHNQPHVEVDGVKWTITKHTPGPLAHPHIGTGADGKQYQVWRGSKGMHLAHPIDSKHVDEGSDTEYTVHMDRNGRERSTSGTIAELLDYFGYTLEVGKSYEHEKGRYKINMNPTSIGQLVDALNKAQSNSAANGQASTHYSMNEGWESGPEEYEEPYDDADDAYDRQRQEKIDTEAEKEWAKKPKKTTYKLTGRGANMEPNHEFGGEFSDLDAAKEYRRKLMADPKTPHPEHIGIRTIERVIDETITPPGSSVVKNINDYIRRRDEIFKALADPKQRDNYPWYKQALFDLNRMAKQAGIKIEESRAHDKLSKWFKDRERAQKFASGELKIPTPQERWAELEKSKKEKVDEYGAENPQLATSTTNTNTPNPVANPDDIKKAMAAVTTLKNTTQSPAPPANIAKALDAASQGKQVGSTDMKALQNTMADVKTIFQDPTLTNQARPLLQKAKQLQQQKS